MQIVEGIRGIFEYFKAKAGVQKIISEDVITYDSEKPLNNLDLVYKKWVLDELESINISTHKSVFLISGLTVINWDSVAKDEEGALNPEGETYSDWYGDYPSNIYTMLSDGTKEVRLDLPVSRLSNGNFEIDATGLTDVRIIIS